MPRMTRWNWLNIKDSRQLSLQHGRQRGITPANIVLQGTIVCMDPNIFFPVGHSYTLQVKLNFFSGFENTNVLLSTLAHRY